MSFDKMIAEIFGKFKISEKLNDLNDVMFDIDTSRYNSIYSAESDMLMSTYKSDFFITGVNLDIMQSVGGVSEVFITISRTIDASFRVTSISAEVNGISNEEEITNSDDALSYALETIPSIVVNDYILTNIFHGGVEESSVIAPNIPVHKMISGIIFCTVI